jgi:hypothetical protein
MVLVVPMVLVLAPVPMPRVSQSRDLPGWHLTSERSLIFSETEQ